MAIIKKKKIKIPVYFGNLILIKVDKLTDINKEYELTLGEDHQACVFDEMIKGIHNYIVAFDKTSTDKVIAHECVHLINRLYIDRGIKLDLVNDEHQAYLMGWFFDECQKFLNNGKKKI